MYYLHKSLSGVLIVKAAQQGYPMNCSTLFAFLLECRWHVYNLRLIVLFDQVTFRWACYFLHTRRVGSVRQTYEIRTDNSSQHDDSVACPPKFVKFNEYLWNVFNFCTLRKVVEDHADICVSSFHLKKVYPYSSRPLQATTLSEGRDRGEKRTRYVLPFACNGR